MFFLTRLSFPKSIRNRESSSKPRIKRTALATTVYYRRRVLGGARDALILGLLPLGAAGFLGWMLVRSVQVAPAAQVRSLATIVVLGVLAMLCARFVLRSPFFAIRRESDAKAR